MNVRAVSILICTYNRARLLRETLFAIQSMRIPDDCVADILVVDNNSTDNTQAVVAESSARGPLPVMYLREERQGKSFALNFGLSRATGDVVALTDDDARDGFAQRSELIELRRDDLFGDGLVHRVSASPRVQTQRVACLVTPSMHRPRH